MFIEIAIPAPPERLTTNCPCWKVPAESFDPKVNAPLFATAISPADSIDRLFKFLIEFTVNALVVPSRMTVLSSPKMPPPPPPLWAHVWPPPGL